MIASGWLKSVCFSSWNQFSVPANISWKVKVSDRPLLACMCVCVVWWPPPNSIYLKTLTNSNYVGPLLWYAVFLSSPAIFDSWADPPPRAHSCLLACCSWQRIQKSCSLSAVPSKTRGTSKGFCRALSTWTELNPARVLEWIVCMWGAARGVVEAQTLFGPLCVNGG